MANRPIFAETFYKSLARLTTDEQNSVKVDVFDFEQDPTRPGFQMHRVENTDEGGWSIRINRDLRLIIYKLGEEQVIAYVDHHDPAYAWATNRRLKVHPETNTAQFEVVGERHIETVKRITRVEVVEPDDPLAARPFEQLDDQLLLSYGTPAALIAPIKSSTVGAFLEGIGDTLPAEAQEFLLAIAYGETPPAPPVRSRDPFTSPDARRRFHVLESDEALETALASPWETWMLFLHPSQRDAVDRDHAGPARVTGGPGTGKSIVAVHRAARLAREESGKVLLTSFSRTLAGHLAKQADLLLAAEPEVRERIDVVHLHHLAVELWTKIKGAKPSFPTNPDMSRLFTQVADEMRRTGITQALLQAEWEMVVEPHNTKTWDEYASVDRTARGQPFNPAQRQAVWPAAERVWALLSESNWRTWSEICWDVVEALDAEGEPPYAHVIADEVQDFGPAELRLLRALVAEGPNDVFLAGDSNQRIYKPHMPFAKAGLEIRGRTATLCLNYRTTEQIRRAADRIIGGVTAGSGEDAAPSAPSLLSGPEPEFRMLAGVNDEITHVANWLKQLVSNGYRPGEIAVFARTNGLISDRVQRAVAAANLKAVDLGDDPAESVSGVLIGTMHRSKGLQFRAVAVMGVEHGVVPLESVMGRQADEAARLAFHEKERGLLYVACSRARERMLVTGVGRGSGLLG